MHICTILLCDIFFTFILFQYSVLFTFICAIILLGGAQPNAAGNVCEGADRICFGAFIATSCCPSVHSNARQLCIQYTGRSTVCCCEQTPNFPAARLHTHTLWSVLSGLAAQDMYHSAACAHTHTHR